MRVVLAGLVLLAAPLGCRGEAAPTVETPPAEDAKRETESAPPAPEPIPTTSLRTSRPTPATKDALARVPDLDVVSFFAPGPVRDQVFGYFSELGVQVREVDQALEPDLAREHSVRENGTILLLAGDRNQKVRLRDDEAKAGRDLVRLDGRVRDALIALERRGTAVVVHPKDKRPKTVRDALAMGAMQVELRESGQTGPFPAETALVLFIDDGQRPMPAGFADVARHLEDGGPAILAFEPAPSPEVTEMLAPLGIELDPTVLAAQTSYAKIRHDRTDRLALATNGFADHPAVAVLRKQQPHSAVAMFGAAALTITDPTVAKAVALVTTQPDAFADANGNFELDAPDETAGKRVLAVAAERDDARVVVFGDATWLDDAVLGTMHANQMMLVDGVRWIAGDPAITEAANEKPETVAYPLRPIASSSESGRGGLWSASLSEMTSVVAMIGDERVTLERDPEHATWWGTVTRADGTSVDFAVDPRGGGRLLESWASPQVRRSLGKIDDAKRAELGLEGSDRIEVVADGKTHALRIGELMYGGAGTVVQDPETEEAYVVDAKFVRPLEAAERTLPRRELLDPEGATAAKLTSHGNTWEVVLEDADDPSRRHWTPEGAGRVVEMALRLRARSFDRKRSPTGLRSVARLELPREGGDPQVLEIYAEGEGTEARYHATWPGGQGLAALHRGTAAEVAAKVEELAP